MNTNFISLSYLVSGVLFILALRMLSSPSSARKGNVLGIIGMVIAISATIFNPHINNKFIVIIGLGVGGVIGSFIALKIKMTAMPQLVAGFHSLVGLAATLIAIAALMEPEYYGIGLKGKIALGHLIELIIGAVVGIITFTGSVIAFLKLQGIMGSKPIRFRGNNIVNLLIAIIIILLSINFCKTESMSLFLSAIFISALLGVLLIIPIGGADMPVIVSMLNSYSGWAAAGIGFTIGNILLIITGALVGASGAILSYIMCKGMNRSILNVVLGGFGTEVESANSDEEEGVINRSSPEDCAFLLKNSSSAIIVPGYGMASAHAQYALKELDDILTKSGVSVKYAIHPVAGRMPGHMNVLLAEAGIGYDKVHEFEDINREFSNADVVYIIGANDITNPAAKTDHASPIYGMPVFDVEKAKNVFFVKRGMSPGYSGVSNRLFFNKNTLMLFGDAKDITERIVKELKSL